MSDTDTSLVQDISRIALGGFMMFAGTGHLTFLRKEFQAQVPDWVPGSKDIIVVLSGIVEILLGLSMVFAIPTAATAGIALAIFFVLIFPGNIAQYKNRTRAFGLNADKARLVRLFFQPVLILWALWSSGALSQWVGF
jgi:uncharacterized membrane protein